MLSQGNVSQRFYENQIPLFAEKELEGLYGSIYSSLPHFRAYGGAENASTYVAWKNEKIAALFLFRREQQQIRVINEWVKLAQEDIVHFADHVFATYPEITQIKFHSIDPDLPDCKFPFLRFSFSENIVVTLPATPELYAARLGAATRKNIKRHRNRLLRDFPSFEFRVYEREAIDESQIRAIVVCNHARMASKNKSSMIDERETARLIALARERGIVVTATIGGRICAGMIAFRFGDNIVARINAHDPAYDDYRLGMVCCYMGICESIDRGAREFHFMWGRYDYKTALLGVLKRLDDVLVYRSRVHMLLNGMTVVRLACSSRIREARIQLSEEIKRGGKPLFRLLGRMLQVMRGIISLRSV